MRNKAFFAIGLLLLTAQASAGKLDFLKDSVLTELNEVDIKSFRQTAYHTLENVSDKKTVFWQGETGVKGKMQAQFSYDSEGIPCRRIRFAFQDTKKLTEAYKFDICKNGEKWHIAATPASSFSEDDWVRFNEELQYTLNTVSNGNPVSWVSLSTGVTGVFVPLTTETKDSQPCRNVAISLIDRKGRTTDGQYRFCQSDNHDWVRDIQAP